VSFSKRRRTIFLLGFLALICVFSVINESPIARASAQGRNKIIQAQGENKIIQIDMERILEHVSSLSSVGSRVTGYPGCYKAADYIINAFNELGLEVKIHNYTVAVPLDLGANITLTQPIQKTFEAYALWPNHVQTSPVKELEGNLVYVSGDSVNSFDGKEIEDAIVVMDFNSWDNWIFAADMGAKAVVFIEPDETSSAEAMKKFINSPIHFPRLFVKKDVGMELVNLILNSDSPVHVVINSHMVWRKVEAQNIIGIVKGTQYPDDIAIISSHYDTWSIVPRISYGANDALGTALLIELARYFASNPPPRTVYFIAFSGHWQAMTGLREFVEDFYFSSDVQEGRIRPWLFVGLGPFSYDTVELQCLVSGFYQGLYVGSPVDSRLMWVRNKIFYGYIYDPELESEMLNLTGRKPEDLVSERLTAGMWWGTQNSPYLIEAEVPLKAGTTAFNILSSPTLAYDRLLGIPISDLDNIDFSKIKPQFIMSAFFLNSLLNDPNWPADYTNYKVERSYIVWGTRRGLAFTTLKGNVIAFNYSKGWYFSIPNAIVTVNVDVMAWPFSYIYTIADENGTFEIHGMVPWHMLYGAEWAAAVTTTVEAWVLNETDGRILYAPDAGIHGAQVFPNKFAIVGHPTEVSVVLANLRSITMFDLLDPRYVRELTILDPRFQAVGGGYEYVTSGGIMKPVEFTSRSDYLSYGIYYKPWIKTGLAFVPPYSKAAILLSIGGIGEAGSRWPVFISNSSNQFPEGSGIKVTEKPTVIRFTSYRIAQDMYFTVKYRYETLKAHESRSLSVEKGLNKTLEHLLLAEAFYSNHTYSKAWGHSVLALSWAFRAYRETMSMISESTVTTLVSFVMVIISALFLERLIVNAESGSNRIIATTALITIFMLMLYFLNPIFSLMTNVLLGMFGCGIMIILGITIGVIIIESEKVMRRVSTSLLGSHVLERGRLGVAMLGSSVSIRFMRRRRLRTIFTEYVIIITCASLVSFTASSPFIGLRNSPTPYSIDKSELLYERGIFLEKEAANPPRGPQSHELVRMVNSIAGDKFIIMPRSLYYPQTSFIYKSVALKVSSPNGFTLFPAVVGLSPEESELILKRAYESGIATGFLPGQYDVCMLSSTKAKILGVSIGDKINALGCQLTVISILNEDQLSTIKDPSGFVAGFPDPLYTSVLSKDNYASEETAGEVVARLSLSEALIVPYRLCLEIGGYVSSIGIIPKSNVTDREIIELAEELGYTLDIGVYLMMKNAPVSTVAKFPTFLLLGYEVMVALLVIGGLNIMVTLLGRLTEMRNDFKTLSVTGLSPLAITSMVILDALMYSLLGCTIGYFLGFAINKLARFLGLLPAAFPFNYASTMVFFSLAIVILISIIGTIYPALTAGKIVAPSLERRWRLQRIIGEEAEIPIPAYFTSQDEATGFLRFLQEFYLGAGSEGSMYRVDRIDRLSTEEMRLELDIRQVPFEMDIKSHVSIYFIPEKKRLHLFVHLKRVSGEIGSWRSGIYSFIDTVRKQFMLWRSFSIIEREKYMR